MFENTSEGDTNSGDPRRESTTPRTAHKDNPEIPPYFSENSKMRDGGMYSISWSPKELDRREEQ